MKNTRFVIQILFRPAVGRPVKNQVRKWSTFHELDYLRKEKQKLWGTRSPTPREKQQAKLIEEKAGSIRFHVAVRIVAAGAGEYTETHLKEVAGGFNVFQNRENGQYLKSKAIRSIRRKPRLRFLNAVSNRVMGGYSRKFQLSMPELASFLAVPDRKQENVERAMP
jgi:hypothetical protein